MNPNDDDRMPPPLSLSTQALLGHERVIPTQPDVVRARALKRAGEALRASPAERLSQRTAPTRIRELLFAAAAALLLVAGIAAAIQFMRRPSPSAPVNPAKQVMAQSVSVPASATPLVEPPIAKDSESTNSTPSATVPAPAKAFSSARNAGFADNRDSGMAELELLTRARQADARGDYARVLAIASEHERAYQAGRLLEEREVLRVRALVGLGRASEARQVAARFRRQFPRSVLLPRIDAMLASLP